MSFQAYVENIQAKTGKTPEQFFDLTKEQGMLPSVAKASVIRDWLMSEFGLGHGHAMALVMAFKLFEAGKNCPRIKSSIMASGIALPKISAPAIRALASLGVKNLQDLTRFSESEISKRHGIGPKVMSILKQAMTSHKLQYKQGAS